MNSHNVDGLGRKPPKAESFGFVAQGLLDDWQRLHDALTQIDKVLDNAFIRDNPTFLGPNEVEQIRNIVRRVLKG